MKPIPAIVPPPRTAAQAQHGEQPRGAGDPERLADDVGDEDAERDGGGVRLTKEVTADRDAGVGQREQWHDDVARPRVIDLLQPFVR